MRAALIQLRARIKAVKAAPSYSVMQKAQAAELALEDALYLIGELVERVEQLEGAKNGE